MWQSHEGTVAFPPAGWPRYLPLQKLVHPCAQGESNQGWNRLLLETEGFPLAAPQNLEEPAIRLGEETIPLGCRLAAEQCGPKGVGE